MSTHLYELPTTGAVSFADFCLDPAGAYTIHIAAATQARANLRAALKHAKRADETDNLGLVKVLDDYIPHLCGIIAAVGAGEIALKAEPIFSWRTTLSATLLNTSPRLAIPGLHTDLAFTLLTYAFALANLARSTVAALGAYERDRALPDAARKASDDKLSFAVTLLCRASGVFSYLSETVLLQWEHALAGRAGVLRPPDLSKEVTTALAKLALADAQTLAVRKLLTKATAESTFSPGPPLPKSHPAPGLVAKLHLDCAAAYAAARALAKTPGSSKLTSPKPKFGLRTKATSPDVSGGGGGGEVAGELRRYLADASALHSALSHKWLGVEAGEASKAGRAVGFLSWAKRGLDELGKDSAMGPAVGEEQASVQVFHKYYKSMNDTLSFETVPPRSELQGLIPSGRSAVAVKAYALPSPSFGPGSVDYIRRQTEALDGLSGSDADAAVSPRGGSYAGEGSYF